MEEFLSKAGRYLKGESGLPSLLPARADIDTAKGKSRRVGLFCKGLENFCEILYPDPSVQEEEHPREEQVISETGAGQNPKKYVLAPCEDLFQSLYPTDTTPPISPASSSSTLIDASSRKVSPSDGAKGSPIVIKDFAYPDHFRYPGASPPSAYACTDILEYSSGELAKLLDTPKGKVEGLFDETSDEVALFGVISSSNPTMQEISKVKAYDGGVNGGLDTYKDSTKREETDEIHNSEDEIEDIFPNDKHEDPVNQFIQTMTDENQSENSDTNDDNHPPAQHITENDSSHRQAQGTCIDHEGGYNQNFEFSEPAGSATLWGILMSNKCEDEANKEADGEPARFSEAAGPATLWGILMSNKCEDEANKEADGEPARFSEAAGPATLWGILRSDQPEEKAAAVDEGLADVSASPAQPSQEAIPEEKNHPGDSEGEKSQASAALTNIGVMQDNAEKGDNQKTCNVASESPRITSSAEIDKGCSGDDCNHPLVPDRKYSSPRVISLPQAEKFDLIPPMAQPTGLTKTQKRKLERRRAAEKKAKAKAAEGLCQLEGVQ